MIDIINAKFITSVPTINLAPEEELPEVAFLARSNVGKSIREWLKCHQLQARPN